MKIIINIDVPELAPAIRFYTAALGLTHSRTLDDDVAELTGASATLYLLQKDLRNARPSGRRPSTATMAATGLRCTSTWSSLTSMRPPPALWPPARNRKPGMWTGEDRAASASAILSAMASVSSSSNATKHTTTSSTFAPQPGAAGPSLDPRPTNTLTLRSSAHSESRKASTWSFCADVSAL